MKLKLWQKILLAIANFLYPCKFYTKDNLPEGNAVIVCNHFSVVDCVHMLNVSKERPYFLGKKEAFENKFLAKLFGSYGGVPIDRNKPDMKAMLTILKLLKSGEKVVIYPEGTRNKTGTNELQEIKGGAGVFAVRAKCPIVPVMMLNKPKIFRKTKLIVGKPFYLEDFYDKKIANKEIEAIDNIVRDKMLEQQRILFEMVKK